MRYLLTALVLLFSFTSFCQSKLTVNAQRMESRLADLSKFGKDSTGKGYRVAYTKGDQQGRAWFITLMKNAGLEVHIDYAGNIIGQRKRKNNGRCQWQQVLCAASSTGDRFIEKIQTDKMRE